MLASVSVHPLELARTRQALGATHGSALGALGDIVRAGGPRALFQVRRGDLEMMRQATSLGAGVP